MKRILAGLVAGLCLPAIACADSYSYVGINYLKTSYDERGFPTSKPTAWSARFGASVGQNVALEARLGSGLSSDTTRLDPTLSMELDIKQLYGIYGRIMVPLNERFSLYGLAGITRVKLEGRGTMVGMPGSVRVSESETDLSLGAGLDLMITSKAFINLEYALLQSDDKVYDLDALSIGLGIRF